MRLYGVLIRYMKPGSKQIEKLFFNVQALNFSDACTVAYWKSMDTISERWIVEFRVVLFEV